MVEEKKSKDAKTTLLYSSECSGHISLIELKNSFFESETTVGVVIKSCLLNPLGSIITIISLSFPVVFIVLGGIAAPALLVSLVGVVRGVLLAAAAALLILSTRVTDPG